MTLVCGARVRCNVSKRRRRSPTKPHTKRLSDPLTVVHKNITYKKKYVATYFLAGLQLQLPFETQLLQSDILFSGLISITVTVTVTVIIFPGINYKTVMWQLQL